MKKILWLPGWYPNKLSPFDGDFIQRHAQALALYQPVQVIFVIKDENCTAASGISIEYNVSGNLGETIAFIKPFKTGIKLVDRIISLLKYIKVSRQLVSEYIQKEGKPPLVHVHVALWAGITALWIKRKFNIAYMVTEHWTGYDKTAPDNVFKRDFFFRRKTKEVLRNALLLLPVTDHLGKLITTNFGPVQYRVIPNVVNTQYFTFAGLPIPVFRFIHVSGMNFQKNAEGILNNFSAFILQGHQAELVMVGPAGKELIGLSERLGLAKHIKWRGEVSYLTVAKELQHASCLLMFSRYENLPCAILEALCCGLPVIATSTGGIAEVINITNGILVPSEDGAALLHAMKTMINNYDAYNQSGISATAQACFCYETVGKAIRETADELL